MRRMVAVLAASAACLFAQSHVGAQCEPVPELRKAIQEIWHDKSRPMAERLRWQEAQWKRLIEQHPRETVLHRRYYLLFHDFLPERAGEIREAYLRRAERNPKDVLAVYMAGLVLEGVDTPRAIATLERAAQLDPGFGWTHLTLAFLYGHGKFQDRQKASESVAAFFRACPKNAEDFSLAMLNQHGSPEQFAATAKALRARLDAESDPAVLRAFTSLWGLEFKTRPVAEHPKQRERVAADLKRLEEMNRKPDADWLAFLAEGMKQCGREKDVPAIEDRILREFPRSTQSLWIAMRRWDAANPMPKGTDRAEVWDAWTRKRIEAVEGWIAEFPAEEWQLLSMLLDQVTALRPADPRRVREVGDRFLRSTDARNGVRAWPRISIADRAYLRLGVDPKRAVELLEAARPLMVQEQARQLDRDDLSDQARRSLLEDHAATELTWAAASAIAYRRAGIGGRAEELRNSVEDVRPTTPELTSQRYAAFGEIAAAVGKFVDAVTFYKAGLDARPKSPPPFRGRLEDPLVERAREIWTLSGGSEEAWRLWSRPSPRTFDSRWEQPRKPLPAFELTDLGGRTWSSKALEGKTLFINIWATWCGPCIAELPLFQKLYERMKDRADVAVFTLNVDDEVGLGEPFLKERGWTFPALPATQYVKRTLDTLEAPQTWIVDGKGMWLWQQVGYDGDPDWERSMLPKIESVK